jgi:hypothetical protein
MEKTAPLPATPVVKGLGVARQGRQVGSHLAIFRISASLEVNRVVSLKVFPPANSIPSSARVSASINKNMSVPGVASWAPQWGTKRIWVFCPITITAEE